MNSWRILTGDAAEQLRALPDGLADCCVTSPPYWGLRDYGVDGQLGLEPTPEEFVAKLVAVFREVRRVLRDDGTLWLNLGDSYCSAPAGNRPGHWSSSGLTNPWRHDETRTHRSFRRDARDVGQAPHRPAPGLKPKDLIGVPWLVAFALRADGWWLRSDIVWAKPNPMPESVTDRPTKSHEYLFLLAKAERYFYDADAIREPHKPESLARYEYGLHVREDPNATDAQKRRYNVGIGSSDRVGDFIDEAGRNKRSVWTVATHPFPEAHFATFPPKLIEPCILAGSRCGGTVLDPFAGSGTTGQVALANGRSFVGIDLNPEYVAMAERRLGGTAPLFAKAAGGAG